MPLFESTYEADGKKYQIICEGPDNGLAGIDGKSWIFKVRDEGFGKEREFPGGVTFDALEKWKQGGNGQDPGVPDLLRLLVVAIEWRLQRNMLDFGTEEPIEPVIVKAEYAADTLAETEAQFRK